jgi:glycosyltransferase involved in cell wall biosynthesis
MEASDLRIALFSGNYNCVRDGANRALNNLVGYLLRQGAQVRVYSPTIAKPAFAPTGDLVPIPSIPIPRRPEYRFCFGLTPGVRRDIRRFAPTHFHLSVPDPANHGALKLARRMNLPVIASVHTRFDTYFRYYGMAFFEPIAEAIMRRFYRRCDAIFAPSESMAQILRDQRMSYDVGIWTRGVDRDVFNAERRDMAWRRSLGIGDDEPVIGFVGRVVAEKGLDIFADTIDRLTARRVPHRVLVIGEGPARAWFEQRLPDARFTGYQMGTDLGRAVASLDMLFNPSVTESFGNVTLEAMACGVPVVAADAAGSTSLLEDGVNGRLIRPGATHSFADALAEYCVDAAMRRAAGTTGLEAAAAYGWDQVNSALLEGYLRIARQRQGGSRGAPPVAAP